MNERCAKTIRESNNNNNNDEGVLTMQKTITANLVRLVILSALLATAVHAQTKFWVGDGSTNGWHTNATPQAWSTTNPPNGGPQPAPDTSYANGDNVVFDRDVTSNTTITVQSTGVTPGSLQIDTGVHWTFQGGPINAFLNHAYTSGASTNLTFKDYDSSPGFTGADIRHGNCNWQLSSAATAGSYTFLSGTSDDINLISSQGTPGFNFDVSVAGTGAYTLTDKITISEEARLNTTVVSGQTVTYGGDIDLNANLALATGGDPGASRNIGFSGTITVGGTQTITSYLSTAGQNQITTGRGDFTGASIAGGAGNNLVLSSSRADMRGFIMPSNGGSNINIGGITVNSASIHIDPTNTSQDYFSGVRNAGGKVTFNDNGTFYMDVTMLGGEYLADDFVFIDDSSNVINVTLGNNTTMSFGLNGLTDTSNDSIDIDGDLELTGVLEIINLGGMEVGQYTLSTFAAGGFTGNLTTLNSNMILSGQLKEATLSLNGDSNALLLDVAKIPEPTSGLLLALAGLLALRRRR